MPTVMSRSYTLRHTILSPDTLLSLAVSSDGRWLAATANDQKLHLWDAVTLAEVKVLHVGKRPKALCFSPDSKLVVAGSTGLTAWDTSSFKRVQTFKGHKREVVRAAFSPDGAWICGGGSSDVSPSDNSVRIWDTGTGEERGRWLPSGSVCALAVSPDGGSIAVSTASGQTQLLDAATYLPRWVDPPEARTSALVFTPGGQLLGTLNHALLFDHDLATGTQREILPADRYGTALAVSTDGAFVFIACAHGGSPDGSSVMAIELATLATSWSAPLGSAVPRGVQISPDGLRVYMYQTSPDRLLVFEQ